MSRTIAELVEGTLRDIPDFPAPGVLFKDITPLLADPTAFAAVIALIVTADSEGGQSISTVS